MMVIAGSSLVTGATIDGLHGFDFCFGVMGDDKRYQELEQTIGNSHE